MKTCFMKQKPSYINNSSILKVVHYHYNIDKYKTGKELKNMNKKAKIASIVGVSAVAVAIVGSSTMAFFKDSKTTSTSGTAGDVTIGVDAINLTNSGNINPGDNDPSLDRSVVRGGTDHVLSYDIENQGNKSVVVRSVITLSVESGLDASKFFLLDNTTKNDLSLSSNVETYYEVNGSYVAKSAYTTGKIDSIRYIVTEKSMDGVGVNNEDETDAVDGSGYTVYYPVGMSINADDTYEKAVLNIDVVVQAMQYRNTADSDWTTVFSDTLKIGQ